MWWAIAPLGPSFPSTHHGVDCQAELNFVGKLNPVFMNLLINAIDAIDELWAASSVESTAKALPQSTITPEITSSSRIPPIDPSNLPSPQQSSPQRPSPALTVKIAAIFSD